MSEFPGQAGATARTIGQLVRRESADSRASNGIRRAVHEFREPMPPEPIAYPNVLDMFANGVRAHGNEAAVRCGSRSMSYRELDDLSNQVANSLLHRGVQKGAIVPILLKDATHRIAAILGILKIGGIFAVLDADDRHERIESRREQMASTLLISEISCSPGPNSTTARFPLELALLFGDQPGAMSRDGIFSGCEIERICDHPTFDVRRPVDNDSPCYLYFTSGSTADAKAVVGRTAGLAHFIQWEINFLSLEGKLVVSQLSHPAFDVYLRDVFVALCSGGIVCIPGDRQILLDPAELAHWLNHEGIVIAHCVPSILKSLLNHELCNADFPELRYLLIAGEVLAPRYVNRWREIFGERNALINLYGPTETTLAKFAYRVPAGLVQETFIPIGKPIAGAQAILLRDDLEPCALGETGEIYIRTPFRSLGYFCNPTRTDAVFIKNPFSQTGDCLDDRLYKTGDLALQLPDGNFRFMGRVDGLVKVRGKRVELGEIEAVLNALAVIREAVVLAREDTFGEARLVAYAVLWPSARPLDSAATRSVLLETLPDHMVPSWYVTLDSLPLTRNGKIDRKALPSPDMTRGEVGYEQPQTETEQRLAIIWAEVLGLDRAGVHDDFFASGGHSLLATQVISRVRAEFQSDISVRTLFDTPTLAAFARRIEQGRQRTPCSAE